MAPPPKPGRCREPATKRKAAKTSKAPEPTTRGRSRGPLLPVPPGLQPKLTAGGYVFPVYGASSSFGDTFGAPRATWPATGTTATTSSRRSARRSSPSPTAPCSRSAGTTIGGYRLWLRDSQGNEFYYAHLSAYSPLAVNGAPGEGGHGARLRRQHRRRRGHAVPPALRDPPASLLCLGYDGAVNPTLVPRRVAAPAGRALQPDVAGWVPRSVTDPRPEPGAILLQISDISSASGLDPGSLQRAMAPGARGAEGQLARSLGQAVARPRLGRRRALGPSSNHPPSD